jgi:hypothetical protein
MNLKHFSADVSEDVKPLQTAAKRALKRFVKAIKHQNAQEHETAREAYFAAADAYNFAVENGTQPATL